MYSFYYDESETWAVWPNHLSLSEFASSHGVITISQLFRYFADEFQDKLDESQDKILDQKSVLTHAMTKLTTALSSYQTIVQVGDDFVRLVVVNSNMLLATRDHRRNVIIRPSSSSTLYACTPAVRPFLCTSAQ